MKDSYKHLDMTIIEFETEDVIVTSGDPNGLPEVSEDRTV